MVVVLAVAAVSMAAGFVVAVLGAESAAAAVESALAERASQVAFRTLLAQDPAFLHLGILHLDSLSIMDDLADPQLRLVAQQQRLIGRRIVSARHAMRLGNDRR